MSYSYSYSKRGAGEREAFSASSRSFSSSSPSPSPPQISPAPSLSPLRHSPAPAASLSPPGLAPHPLLARDSRSFGRGLGSGAGFYVVPGSQSMALDSLTVEATTLLASGSAKDVFLGVHSEAERAGEHFVCKLLKPGTIAEDAYVDAQLRIVPAAQDIVTAYAEAYLDRDVWLNESTFWSLHAPLGPTRMALTERLLHGFQKFNSNSGWTPPKSTPESEVMQALSHFSFHYTRGSLLLCDLQGAVYSNAFVLSDPAIQSQTKEYGPMDFGPVGIANFFTHHQCTEYCQPDWLGPRLTRQVCKPCKGTCFVPLRKQCPGQLILEGPRVVSSHAPQAAHFDAKDLKYMRLHSVR